MLARSAVARATFSAAGVSTAGPSPIFQKARPTEKRTVTRIATCATRIVRSSRRLRTSARSCCTPLTNRSCANSYHCAAARSSARSTCRRSSPSTTALAIPAVSLACRITLPRVPAGVMRCSSSHERIVPPRILLAAPTAAISAATKARNSLSMSASGMSESSPGFTVPLAIFSHSARQMSCRYSGSTYSPSASASLPSGCRTNSRDICFASLPALDALKSGKRRANVDAITSPAARCDSRSTWQYITVRSRALAPSGSRDSSEASADRYSARITSTTRRSLCPRLAASTAPTKSLRSRQACSCVVNNSSNWSMTRTRGIGTPSDEARRGRCSSAVNSGCGVCGTAPSAR